MKLTTGVSNSEWLVGCMRLKWKTHEPYKKSETKIFFEFGVKGVEKTEKNNSIFNFEI